MGGGGGGGAPPGGGGGGGAPGGGGGGGPPGNGGGGGGPAPGGGGALVGVFVGDAGTREGFTCNERTHLQYKATHRTDQDHILGFGCPDDKRVIFTSYFRGHPHQLL